MKTVFKLLLMAVAYLAIFILGAASGAEACVPITELKSVDEP